MLTRTQHLFDEATRVVAGDSRWQGRTSPDYYAFVGPFGGFTAATILRALIEHPQRAGDPLALTVNYCAPIAEGEFDLDVRLVKANRSSQHWCVELSQGSGDVATLATAVFAERRPSWSHQAAQMPEAKPFATIPPYTKSPRPGSSNMISASSTAIRILRRPRPRRPAPIQSCGSATACRGRSTCCRWCRCRTLFSRRVFHARRELVPFGTVTLTTYFHLSAEDLAAEDITHVLACADAKIFNRSYQDQSGELWSPSGKLIATTTQMGYFKA